MGKLVPDDLTPGQKLFLICVYVGAAVFALLLVIGAMISRPNPDALLPCTSEDSTHCYWDAQTQGNGHGHDFVSR